MTSAFLKIPEKNLAAFSTPLIQTPFLKSTFLRPGLNSTPYLQPTKNNNGKIDSEQIFSFIDFKLFELQPLMTNVKNTFLKDHGVIETILTISEIEINLQMLKDFEEQDLIHEKVMEFFLLYFMKLQLNENKKIFYLKIFTKHENDPQIPKKNFYKYLIFFIKVAHKWTVLIYNSVSENSEVFFYPERAISKMEMFFGKC